MNDVTTTPGDDPAVDPVETTTPVLPSDDIPTDVEDELLTEEERAALAEGDEAEDTYDPDDDAAAEGAPDPSDPAAAPDPAAQPPAAHQPFVRQDFKAPLAALDAKTTELETKWENGDIADADYKAQLKQISREQAALELRQQEYQQREAEDQRNWLASVNSYKAANPALFDDPAVRAAFDREVGIVTSTPAFAKLPFDQQLARAHARLAADADVLGLSVPPAAARAPAKTQAKAPAKAAAPAPAPKVRPAPPPTLARLPASDLNTPGDGKFAAIDRVIDQSNDVVMTEAILARMTPEERDAYGRGDDLY